MTAKNLNTSPENFQNTIALGYAPKGESITLGGGMLGGAAVKGANVQIALKTMNRHGLIAGATGTGKTKTLQVIAEQLAENGVPCLMMDVKGDLSGIAAQGEAKDFILERAKNIGIEYKPTAYSTEFLSLSNEKGAKLRATVSEFGPILLSKILALNEVQSGIISIIFKFADDNRLPIVDLEDLKKVLQYAGNEGAEKFQKEYGNVSVASIATINRQIIALEQEGAEKFFGEPSFEVDDLLAHDENGEGVISIIRLTDIQQQPRLFSTFMLQLLSEIYESFPEKGDAEKPELCIFIDEAHLIFNEASKALLEKIESVIKLIRSKGVGIYFITQNPQDIPEGVLAQLGLKVQHALRAFTAKDRKAIKLAAENYPESEFYDVEELITQLGIGEAFVTSLSEKGIPTPLVHCLLRAPQSRMDILSENEIDEIVKNSELVKKYNKEINRESAYEILSKKIARSSVDEASYDKNEKEVEQASEKNSSDNNYSAKGAQDMFGQVLKSPLAKQVARTATSIIVRGILGALGVRAPAPRRRTYRKGYY